MHAVLAKLGVEVTHTDIIGCGGGLWLDQLVLPAPHAAKIASQRALSSVLKDEIARSGSCGGEAGCGQGDMPRSAGADGIGPVRAAVICAEIGDVTWYRKPGQLCSGPG